MFVIFSLLEFCAAVAALAFGYAAIKQHNYTRMVRGAGAGIQRKKEKKATSFHALLSCPA